MIITIISKVKNKDKECITHLAFFSILFFGLENRSMTYVYLTSYTQAKHLFFISLTIRMYGFSPKHVWHRIGKSWGGKKKKEKQRCKFGIWWTCVTLPTILSCMSLEGQTCPPFSYVNGPNFNPNANIRYVASPTRLEIRTFIMCKWYAGVDTEDWIRTVPTGLPTWIKPVFGFIVVNKIWPEN